MSEDEIEKLNEEFRAFRRNYTMLPYCKAIRTDEVSQFVIYKLNKLRKELGDKNQK